MGLLDGKVAIVTGAGHGIGRGHAMEMARLGARVVVNDLGGSERGEGAGKAADDTVQLIVDAGGEAVSNYGDVSDHDQCGELVQQAIDSFGQLDILVNNAGIVRDAAIWNMPVDDWDLVMRVHVRGTWSTSHFAAKYFREQRQERRLVARSHHQHHVGRRPRWQLRPDGLRHRQGGDRRPDAHARAGAVPLERHRELHRPRRPHPHHRHDAGVRRGVRAQRRARGRVEPDGPEEQLAGGGVAGQRRGRLRDRPGDPGHPRQAHLDGRLVRAGRRQLRGQAVGRRASSA